MPSTRQAIKRMRDRWLWPPSDSTSIRALHAAFRPTPSGSLRALLAKLTTLADAAEPVGGGEHPYYRRLKPKPQPPGEFIGDSDHIDLTHAHMPPYGVQDPVAEANRLFDKRAAATVHSAVDPSNAVRIFPTVEWRPLLASDDSLWPFHIDDAGVTSEKCCENLVSDRDLLELKFYGSAAPTVHIATGKCLPALAFGDYFPKARTDLPELVSKAILAASAGWCGTFGPGVEPTDLLGGFLTGDYDMSQMHLLPLAYRYYDELTTPEARTHLIETLLAKGTVHRVGELNVFTNGGMPDDWNRAGIIDELGLHKRVGETENHVLMILTARYLTNQLLYQRNPDPAYDNRRNGFAGAPACTSQILTLLRNILCDDFSEYNAKPYQTQTRYALLNLCSYAYDHEVRLAARMVLDYVSAHVAVSSSDLRRMPPFRRRNEPNSGRNAQLAQGFMDVGLLEWFLGADPLVVPFAIQTGNLRAYERGTQARPWEWGIVGDRVAASMEALSDYRLPPTIHDLFVNDEHRRFFQRLHRTEQGDVEVTGRTGDNHEIYAGSPSYLISAGGGPAPHAIDPRISFLGIIPGGQEQQLGVAVTTSFMPTTRPNWICGDPSRARDLIQFSHFSDVPLVRLTGQLKPFSVTGLKLARSVANYGVGPDFACGHQLHLPAWVIQASLLEAVRRLRELGILPTAGWVSVRDLIQRFPSFQRESVRAMHYLMRERMLEHLHRDGPFLFVNRGSVGGGPGFYLAIFSNEHGACLEAFDTWRHPDLSFEDFKRRVLAANSALDIQNDLPFQYTTQNGNRIHAMIWNGPRPPQAFVVERGIRRPLRPDELREAAGQMGLALVREHGGATVGAEVTRTDYGGGDARETLSDAGDDKGPFLRGSIMNSRDDGVVEITNPALGTTIRLDMSQKEHPKRTSETGELEEAGAQNEVWVNFGWKGPTEGDFFRPFNTIRAAVAAVADRGVIKIMPGWTNERPVVSGTKRIRLTAVIGGVTFGVR